MIQQGEILSTVAKSICSGRSFFSRSSIRGKRQSKKHTLGLHIAESADERLKILGYKYDANYPRAVSSFDTLSPRLDIFLPNSNQLSNSITQDGKRPGQQDPSLGYHSSALSDYYRNSIAGSNRLPYFNYSIDTCMLSKSPLHQLCISLTVISLGGSVFSL